MDDVLKDILDTFWRGDEEIGEIIRENTSKSPVRNPFPRKSQMTSKRSMLQLIWSDY